MSRLKFNAIVVVFLLLITTILVSSCDADEGSQSGELRPATNILKTFNYAEPSDDFKKLSVMFEEKYDCKVEVTILPMEQISQRIIAAISSGDSPDWVSLHSGNYPRDPIKNITIPLDPYEEYYGGFDDELWDQSVIEQYSWNGKRYGISAHGDPIFIYYNKTMFEDNGLETPMELYKKGEWNWDTFREAAMILTQDTTNDGVIDQWGYASWQYELFVLSNGGSIVEYEDDNIKLNFNDPKTTKALQFMQEGFFQDKYMVPDGNSSWGQLFQNGKVAMTTERSWRASIYIDFNQMSDEWDLAPFPFGPDNTDKVFPADNVAYGLCNGSKNPEGAALFTRMYYEYYEDLQKSEVSMRPDGKPWSEETIEMMKEVSGKTVAGRYNGIGNWWQLQTPFWSSIFNGIPISTAIQTYSPTFQREIDLMLRYEPITEIEPFTEPETLNFEDGLDYMTTDLCEKSDTNGVLFAGITEDSNEVIEGSKSLKLISDKTTEWQVFIRSDETKLRIPPMHQYKVTFDYKIIEDSAGDGLYFVTMREKDDVITGVGNYGMTVIDGVFMGDSGFFEAIIPIYDNVPDLCLVIGGRYSGGIVIDNLSITEAPMQ